MTKKDTNRKKYSKKTVVTIGMLVLMVGVASASWLLSVSDSLSGQVISDPQGLIYFTETFQDIGTIDTTNTSVSINRTSVITNENGLLHFLLNINETIIDVDDLCDPTGDLTTVYKLNGDIVTDGETVNITSGDNPLTAEFDYVLQSCPTNLTVNFNLVQV